MTIFPPEQKFLQDTQSKRMEKWFFRNMRIILNNSIGKTDQVCRHIQQTIYRSAGKKFDALCENLRKK